MQELVEEAIVRKARAILRGHRLDELGRYKFADRYEKRTGNAAGVSTVTSPRWWTFHPHFDPKYCIRHARYLSKVIWRRLEAPGLFYEPIPAIQFDVPKPDGSTRQIMAFSIPDAALANVIHRNITRRNLNSFSSSSFAYRPDRTVFDAIINLQRAIAGHKTYIVQYDFSKFFDTISHSYLREILFARRTFLTTGAERRAIEAFMEHSYCHVNTYTFGVYDSRTAGVPQGSSLSLFLSNAAAHELDLALERQNGTFVRFADDVVAVTSTYADALQVAARFRDHCRVAGLKINFEKSDGIKLLSGGPERERRDFVVDGDDGARAESISHIDYLGHRISPRGVTLPSKSVKRIKRHISSLIHKHLFLHRRGAAGAFNPERVGAGFVDWDLVTCLNEIRRYIYGGLREAQLENFLAGGARLPFVRGLMAFFPLSTEIEQLKSLDGWLLNVIRRAQRERVRVADGFGVVIPQLQESELRQGTWYDYPEVFNETKLPSFVRGWRAARKHYLRYGLNSIQPPSYYSLLSY